MSAPSDLAGFRCWDVADARRVLDVDAFEVPASVFRAVHHPVRFVRRSALPGEGTGVSRLGPGEAYDERAFLDDLMDPAIDYRLVSVIGPSGAGKSHLIRWLFVRAREQAGTQRILFIPRAGTNLRGVLRMVLDGLEGPEFERYRERLHIAEEGTSAEVGRGRLLEAIAERVEHADPDALKAGFAPDRGQHVQWVQQQAPAFLRDDVFRGEWLRPEGVIGRLYDLALGGASEVDRAEARRVLTVEDLPLDIDPRRVSGASRTSQQFYNALSGERAGSGPTPLTDVLLGVLNSVRDDAVRSLLAVGTVDLGELFTEVRRELARQGRELVLLIEDVARLQGIDRQLLDALLERPNAEDPPLCALRAVVGCTTAYYQEELPNTFRTRCSFVVDLAGEGAGTGEAVPMALGYLNASRLGLARLDAWAEEGVESVPSACDACGLRDACHQAFGEEDGVGYYPFNRTALRQTYGRTNATDLNPRFLISDVLRRTLVDYAEAMDRGAFPSATYHAAFGGVSSRWDASALARVRRVTGGGEREARTKALLDLWSAGGAVPPGVFEAFRLPPLDLADGEDAPTQEEEAPPPVAPEPLADGPDRTTHPEAGVQRWLDALDAWARGEPLDSQATNEMRGRLFDLVNAGLDWDAARLLPKALASRSGGRPLQRPSFNFEGQARGAGKAEVSVTLPTDLGYERSDVALALQGLIRYGVYGSWTFDGGGEALRRVARLSTLLCREVERQLREPEGVAFDPAAAVAEVLALGAQLHGLPLSSQTSHGDRLDAWYVEWPPLAGTPEWKRLGGVFAKQQGALQEALESVALCPKGGVSSTRWFDTVQFAPVLKRKNAVPKQPLPPDPEALPSWLRVVGQTRKQFDDRVGAALEAEVAWWTEWSERVEGACGDAGFGEVRESVNETRRVLEKAGVPHLGRSADEAFQSLSRGLNTADVERARALARTIRDADRDRPGPLLRTLGFANTLRRAADACLEYLDYAEKGAAQAEQYLSERLQGFRDSDATALHVEIRNALVTLETVLLPPAP